MLSIVERLTATSQQLQDAGLGQEAASAIASAIAVAQEENSNRMNAMEKAISEMGAAIKVLSEKVAECQIATERKIADAQIATERKIADAQIANEKKFSETNQKISDANWAMFWKVAFLMVLLLTPVYAAILGRVM